LGENLNKREIYFAFSETIAIDDFGQFIGQNKKKRKRVFRRQDEKRTKPFSKNQ
jgi:hypothetical protein